MKTAFKHCGRANCQRCNEEAEFARDSEPTPTPPTPRPQADGYEKRECLASESGRHESKDGWWCDWCSEEI